MIPVFLAEIDATQPSLQFIPFRGIAMNFPDLVHCRKPSSQLIVDELAYEYWFKDTNYLFIAFF